MNNIKCILVGDVGVGKTQMIISYIYYGSEYIPTVFDNYFTNILVDGMEIHLGLWDIQCHKIYDKLRPLSYPQADVVIICFDIMNRESFKNTNIIWRKEIEHHLPEIPILLVGNKLDLSQNFYEENKNLSHINNDKLELFIKGYFRTLHIHKLILPKEIENLCIEYYRNLPISHIEGVMMATKIGAEMYLENSALSQQGLANVFQETARSALNHRNKRNKKKHCAVL
eukprot:5251_1